MYKYIIENSYIKIWFEEDSICCSYETDYIDLATAKIMVVHRLEACNSQSYPLFVDIRKIKTLKKDARHFLAHEEGAKQVLACALLIESDVSKMIGNFFLNVNKPKTPVKIFTKKEEALKWLKKYKEHNQLIN